VGTATQTVTCDSGSPHSPPLASCPDGRTAAPTRVLVVDDEPVVREVLRTILEQEGCIPLEASNGAEALDILREGRAEVAIVDLWMPKMNGVEFLEAVDLMGLRMTKIVLSAHVTASSTERLRALGVVQILKKPFDIEQIKAAVRECLRGDDDGLGAPSQQAGASQARPSILVADDDDDFRVLMEKILSTNGYRAEFACDGREAVEKALAHGFDVVVVDLNMPHMSGHEAVKSIRSTSPDCIIMAVTGECTQQEISEVLRAGAVACLRKPFEVDTFLGEMKRLEAIATHRRRRAERKRAEPGAHLAPARRHSCRGVCLALVAVATVVVAAAAVPVLASLVSWAFGVARSASEAVHDAAGSAGRIEGYLQRDEERELGRR